MSRYIVAILATSMLCPACGGERMGLSAGRTPIDSGATDGTVELYGRLFEIAQHGTMVAHQDDLAYGHGWYGIEGRSDVRDVVDDYPAVLGLDLGHLELGIDHNLDSVDFADMRRYIRETHDRRGITTVSWHADNPATGGSTWDAENEGAVRSVLAGSENHEKFLSWLDRLADFFGTLKGADGEAIPVVLRLYHEQNGAWFWWGSEQCTAEEYKRLWRMTVEYLREVRGVHNLLYAFSPNFCADSVEYLERYPGDEYVDIVGFDGYYFGEGPQALEEYKANMERNIDIVANYAAVSGKLPIVAETGIEGVPYADYFTGIIHSLIAGRGLGWILFWRNAWESGYENHFYMPFPGHPAVADLKEFVALPEIFTIGDVAKIDQGK